MNPVITHALPADAFIALMRAEGERRYHDRHPFHLAMHEGRLGRDELQTWVLNRYYYQSRLPIKDALILAKSEDPAFRRGWVRRVLAQDGEAVGEGGLASWLALARAVGLEPARVQRFEDVLPGVKEACDEYVALVARSPLVVAVASSLTELFAPDLMGRRLAAWEQHYPWVDREALRYFRARVSQARTDAEEGVAFVRAHATSAATQTRCLAALVEKTEILWRLLDCVQAACARTPAGSAA
jgi:pyrroloquinoline-quinone synthase